MLTASTDKLTLSVLTPLLLLGYVATKIFYNLLLHPLRTYPGPLLARATLLVYQKQILNGHPHLWLQDLHRIYGPVVRCSPNILSFIEPEVWKDVYGYKATSFLKDIKHFYGPDAYGSPPGLMRADNVNHAHQRKLVSHAFSDKALKDQEQLLKDYAKTLIDRLYGIAVGNNGRKADLVKWYNFLTFDIMADLTFGESLGQLKSSNYDPWVESTFSFLKVVAVARIGREWPGLTRLLSMLIPADIKSKRQTHRDFASEKVDKRMARKTSRPDIWKYVTKNSGVEGEELAQSELRSNGALFMLAGTETTATELSGLTYMLLKHPEKLARLKEEIGAAFATLDDITMTKLSQLEYLQACIDEGLRLYPPISGSLPRITPKGGAEVCGRWVPGGTTVQCSIHAAFRSPINFNNSETFAPERFLPEGKKEYGSDRRDALNPFSYGPRNCLGKNLAYHEMRLILASVFLHFDLELCDETGDWLDQENYILWDKKPLIVKLKPAH